MDKISRLVASTLSEGCSKKTKEKGKFTLALRKLRSKNEASEYFKALLATANESLEAFLR